MASSRAAELLPKVSLAAPAGLPAPVEQSYLQARRLRRALWHNASVKAFRSRCSPRLRLLLMSLLLGRSLSAWGSEGHKIIARIAEAHLSARASAATRQILGPGRHLADIANIADEVRSRRPPTATWHFVNIQLHTTSYDPTRDCPRGQCVIAAVDRSRRELAMPGLSPEARAMALYDLVHFVGDLHQPLHCADNQDRGGNDVKAEFLGKPGNLHRIWDAGILDWILRFHPDRWEALALRLARISAADQSAWSRGTAEEWAMEAHEVARKVAYRFRPPLSGPVVLDKAYARRGGPVVRLQLAKGGVRLALLLNRALAAGE